MRVPIPWADPYGNQYIVSFFFDVDFLWQDLGSRESSWGPIAAREGSWHFFSDAGSRRPVGRFGRPDMFLIPTHREGSIPRSFARMYWR